MILRCASEKDAAGVEALRRANQEAVGFIPFSRYVAVTRDKPCCLLVASDTPETVDGFLYWTPGLPVAAIQQLVVDVNHRGQGIGRLLVVSALRLMVQDSCRFGVTLRCRANLPSVGFWQGQGFDVVRSSLSGRRGPVLRLYRELRPALLPLGSYLPR